MSLAPFREIIHILEISDRIAAYMIMRVPGPSSEKPQDFEDALRQYNQGCLEKKQPRKTKYHIIKHTRDKWNLKLLSEKT